MNPSSFLKRITESQPEEMVEVKVRGGSIFIDKKNEDKIKGFSWYINKGKSGTSVMALVSLPRFILDYPSCEAVDHKDRNPLNNLESNLRKCSYSQNAINRSTTTLKWGKNKSKYRGVYYKPRSNKKWMSTIMYEGVSYQLGNFETEVEAAQAYDKKAKELHGEFASLNFI